MCIVDEQYWEGVDLIQFDGDMLQSKGFSLQSIDVLSKKGLPEWAAPNMNFDYYEPNKLFLKIGEDRNDESIYVDFETMFILLGTDGVFINSDPFLFRTTLKLYAEMVEAAILINEDAFIDNKIKNSLIERFIDELKTIDEKALDADSFWSNEVYRLLKHLPDS
jgi:hypothetical protein